MGKHKSKHKDDEGERYKLNATQRKAFNKLEKLAEYPAPLPSVLQVPMPPPTPVHHTTTVNIREHRAPTDDSVKLLQEMEKAAQDRLVANIRVSNNAFDCHVHVYKVVIQPDCFDCVVEWMLNEQRHTTKVQYTRNRMRGGDPIRQMVELVRDTLAKEIANAILTDAFNDVERDLYGLFADRVE